MAQQAPNSYYQITNEPDWGPYITPERYAVYYHYFYDHLKKYDPDAKVSFGGIAWPVYNHAYKWRNKELINDPRLNSFADRIPSATDRNNAAWLLLFWHEYQRLYGTKPPLHWWNTHHYPFYENSRTNANAATAIADTQVAVGFVRQLMQQLGEGHKPHWITEYGHGRGTCSTHASCDQQSDIARAYIQGITPWLFDQNRVQKAFWFYAYGNQPENAPPWLGSVWDSWIMPTTDGTNINALGQTYRALTSQLTDNQAPTITQAGITRITPNRLEVEITATDAGSGLSEVWFSFGSQGGQDDLRAWRSRGSIASISQLTFVLPSTITTGTAYLNLKVQDAYSNQSAVRSISLNCRNQNYIYCRPSLHWQGFESFSEGQTPTNWEASDLWANRPYVIDRREHSGDPGSSEGDKYIKVAFADDQQSPLDPYATTPFIETGSNVTGKTFLVSFKAKTQNSNLTLPNFQLQRHPLGNDWSGTIIGLGTINLTPTWQTITRTVTFPAPANGSNTSQLRLVLRPPQITQDWPYFDAIYIMQVSETLQNDRILDGKINLIDLNHFFNNSPNPTNYIHLTSLFGK